MAFTPILIRVVGTLAFLFGTLQTGCNAARQVGELRVPLIMRETESSKIDPIGAPPGKSVGAIKVRVEPGSDDRAEKNLIGQNREERDAVPVHSEGGLPLDFVREALALELSNLGFQVTQDPAAATKLVDVRLTQFFVIERSTYE